MTVNKTHRPRLAFYAPMKSPNHPIPSGDREIARLLMRALFLAGYEVELISEFISYQKRPSEALFEDRKRDGLLEAARVLDLLRGRGKPERPVAWMTYHPYCKSPDWLGPRISAELKIPYATVEAGRTRQNTDDDWRLGREAVSDAIQHAALNFCSTRSDLAYLEEILPDHNSIVEIVPFLDFEATTKPAPLMAGAWENTGNPVVLTVGMMRPNAKLESFRMLAESLRGSTSKAFELVVVGDGPERATVEKMFSFIPENRLHFVGSIPKESVFGLMQNADIFAWPGFHEAIGMVFLEAAANALPILGMASLGVPKVVANGLNGILVPEGDVIAYAAAFDQLLLDIELRKKLALAGPQYVKSQHDISAASQTLKHALQSLQMGEL